MTNRDALNLATKLQQMLALAYDHQDNGRDDLAYEIYDEALQVADDLQRAIDRETAACEPLHIGEDEEATG